MSRNWAVEIQAILDAIQRPQGLTLTASAVDTNAEETLGMADPPPELQHWIHRIVAEVTTSAVSGGEVMPFVTAKTVTFYEDFADFDAVAAAVPMYARSTLLGLYDQLVLSAVAITRR